MSGYDYREGETFLHLETAPALFSPSAPDRGTLALLSLADAKKGDRVLDLGCGCGLVGLLLTKRLGGDAVGLCDVDAAAVACAKRNAQANGLSPRFIRESDAFSLIPERDFTQILSNPPYHTDFSVAKRMIEGSFAHLEVGGRLLMVTKRLDWYKNKLTTVFGGVRVTEKDGYCLFLAEKRSDRRPQREKPPQTLSPKLRRRQEKRNAGEKP